MSSVAGVVQPYGRSSQASDRLFEPAGLTLEDVILDAWEDLAADGRAECPVCGDSIERGAACSSCGSELS